MVAQTDVAAAVYIYNNETIGPDAFTCTSEKSEKHWFKILSQTVSFFYLPFGLVRYLTDVRASNRKHLRGEIPSHHLQRFAVMKSFAGYCFIRRRRSCGAADHVTLAGFAALQVHSHSPLTLGGGTREKIDLPSIHGEISVEHLFAHFFPLNSAGEFQVCELVSQKVRLHKTLRMGQTPE